ncbi:MAG: pyridoxamine 5'-phosphate oxidase family protein [Lachnospiraceae bacterium]|nr:pyridoxamine 5'-phosphate oxidase family protein [Lachnospiraceae bacterium]
MGRIAEELKKVGVFYVATADGDQPRVRPFGAVAEFEGKVYICTNNTKDCYKQMINNPKTEITGMYQDGATWLRLSGELVRDDRNEAREAMLAANESLKRMYHIGDGVFEVLYIKNPVCTKYSFMAAPETIQD